MSFISFSFAILFLIILLLRATIGRNGNEKIYLYSLLFTSLFFYSWHVPIYVLILIISTFINFIAAQYMYIEKLKKTLLVISITINLGILATFKYYNFLIDINNHILAIFGLEPSFVEFNIILPIGISFYTFQAMSYTIDIYRGTLKPISKYAMFLLYISFFPQLVAGPIVRAKDFLYQINRKRRIRLKAWGEGLYLIIFGLFLKIVIGDNLGTVVDKYWEMGYSNGTVNSSIVSLSLVFFSFQILADFLGYTNIARGIAYLLGFKLPINFNAPYIASSFSNFWQRWHISLSTWIKDYFYISLGGNKVSKNRLRINLLLVMTISGLWHGAAYVFIVWGFIHGIALVIEHEIRKIFPKIFYNFWFTVFWFFVVQITVLITWVYFRSDTVTHANQFISNILIFNFSIENLQNDIIYSTMYIIPLLIYHLRIFIVEKIKFLKIGIFEKVFISGVCLYFILTMYANAKASFIYFQF